MPDINGSSKLTGYTYNPVTQTMSITFIRGDVYTYFGVPPDIPIGLELAPSAGQYFNENILGQYSFSRRDSGGRFRKR